MPPSAIALPAHRRRYAFDPSHPPDDLVALCALHHDWVHSGLIQNEGEDPRAWEFLVPGQAPQLGPVDRAVPFHRTKRPAG